GRANRQALERPEFHHRAACRAIQRQPARNRITSHRPELVKGDRDKIHTEKTASAQIEGCRIMLKSNEQQRQALEARKQREAELEAIMKAESAKLRTAHASKGPHKPKSRPKSAPAPKGWN